MPSLRETVTLDDHEDVVELFRMDNGPMIRTLFIGVLLVLVLFFFMTPLFRLGIGGVGVFLIFFGICVLLGWRAIIKSLGSVCLATTARIIVIERTGFWTKKVREVAYKEIVHSQYIKKGLVNTARDVGSVQCMLKSTVSAFSIDHIIHPRHLLEVIGSHTTFSSPVHPESEKHSRPSFVHQKIPIPAQVKTSEPASLDEYWDNMQS